MSLEAASLELGTLGLLEGMLGVAVMLPESLGGG